jgi:hypothetical protein
LFSIAIAGFGIIAIASNQLTAYQQDNWVAVRPAAWRMAITSSALFMPGSVASSMITSAD